jgi:hypothetical protein
MRKISSALAAGLALAAGCKESPVSPPVDAPTVDALSGAITRAGLQTLALGVVNGDRAVLAGAAAPYLVLSQIYTRDLYRVDASEPRYVTETLGGTPDPGAFSAGGVPWTNAYVAVRAANSTIAALPNVLADQVSTAEKNATSGFVRTFKALDTYRVLEMRDTIGAVIQGNDPTKIDPLYCKPVVINYVAALLDSALTDLNAAGAATKLPFTLPTGFQSSGPGGIDFTTVSNVIRLNRGLKGKVDVYRGLLRPTPVAGSLAAAITELTTFLGAGAGAVTAADFAKGAYHTYVAGGTENTANPLSDSRVGANPKAAQTATTFGAFGGILAGDTRASKFVSRPGATTAAQTLAGQGVSTTITLASALSTNAANQTKPLGILRFEEAVLLRAQAYFESGDFSNGLLDLNRVHTAYGLPAYTSAQVATIAQARQAVLYDKRYSLVGEGISRLVDLRAYGLLNAQNTPAEVTGDPFNTAFPIPKGEADVRGGAAAIKLTCS